MFTNLTLDLVRNNPFTQTFAVISGYIDGEENYTNELEAILTRLGLPFEPNWKLDAGHKEPSFIVWYATQKQAKILALAFGQGDTLWFNGLTLQWQWLDEFGEAIEQGNEFVTYHSDSHSLTPSLTQPSYGFWSGDYLFVPVNGEWIKE